MTAEQTPLTPLRKALKDRYFAPLKDKPELYLGIELEFPLIHRQGLATDLTVTKGLMNHLAQQGFIIEQRDEEGTPVSLIDPESGDNLLFECSYNTLEIAFAKAATIGQVAECFQTYLTQIQTYLSAHDHVLVGQGINPNWRLNDNSPVKLPRYQMLAAYLDLGQDRADCHDFSDYGSYICGNQVQFDVSASNYLRVLNAFNQIEAAKAYLFANSAFDGADWGTGIARDIFWEKSMHGLIQENIGVYPQDFATESDFLSYLEQSALFTVQREGQTYYFPPMPLTTFLTADQVEVWDLSGQSRLIVPDVADLANHRSYHYQVLTTRGTVELRSVCTQPLDKTFAPAAFQLGLLVNLDKLEAYLSQATFFTQYGRDYPALRRQFSAPTLSSEEERFVRDFAQDLLRLAREGLDERGFGEAVYLADFS